MGKRYQFGWIYAMKEHIVPAEARAHPVAKKPLFGLEKSDQIRTNLAATTYPGFNALLSSTKLSITEFGGG